VDEFLGEGEVGPDAGFNFLQLGLEVLLSLGQLVYKPFLYCFFELVRFVKR
jgi:hypothetical protein